MSEHSIEDAAALTARLLYDNPDCELVGLGGAGRCIEPAVAARIIAGFVDLVCTEHAERALARGIRVVFPPT